MHVILAILRSLSPPTGGTDNGSGAKTAAGAGMGVPFLPLKTDIGAICLARGWETDEAAAVSLGQRNVYWTQAKRAVKIDRKQCFSEGGKVVLPIQAIRHGQTRTRTGAMNAMAEMTASVRFSLRPSSGYGQAVSPSYGRSQLDDMTIT